MTHCIVWWYGTEPTLSLRYARDQPFCLTIPSSFLAFPGNSLVKKIHLPSNRHGFGPWIGKTPLRRKWQRTLVFLPGKSYEQRDMVG